MKLIALAPVTIVEKKRTRCPTYGLNGGVIEVSEPEILEISEVELVCTYGPGDNYKPCNRGKRQHILKRHEEELKERYSNRYGNNEDWECPQCGNHAMRVNIKTRQLWDGYTWINDSKYWEWS